MFGGSMTKRFIFTWSLLLPLVLLSSSGASAEVMQPSFMFGAAPAPAREISSPEDAAAKAANDRGDEFSKNKDYGHALPEYKKACDGGHADGCFQLGYMYKEAHGVERDYALAISLYKKACDLGSLLGCNALGYMYDYVSGVPQDYARAMALYKRACDGGEVRGCHNLGAMYQYGKGIPQDFPRALALYNQACNGGVPIGCTNLGIMYESGSGVSQDYTKAAALYKQACDLGEANGCNNLGAVYQYGKGIPQDFPRAAAFYQQACDHGNAAGCYSLGAFYNSGQGVTLDNGKALAFFKQACDAGNMVGCFEQGYMYDSGQGVQQDYGKAAPLYEQSCRGGAAEGCFNLAFMYDHGQGLPIDKVKAAALYKQACDVPIPAACTALGMKYDYGKGVQQDRAKAASLYRQACEKGDAGGCNNLGFLYDQGLGVPQDVLKAIAFHQEACKQGLKPACGAANDSMGRLSNGGQLQADEIFHPKDPIFQTQIRLDRDGGVMEDAPALDQDKFGDCYAQAAAIMWTAVLKHEKMYDPTHAVSPRWLALQYLDSDPERKSTSFVTFDQKTGEYGFPFESGRPEVAAATALRTLKQGNHQNDSVLVGPSAEFDLCDAPTLDWMSTKQKLTDAWVTQATASEKQAASSGRGPIGPGSTWDQLESRARTQCASRKQFYRLPGGKHIVITLISRTSSSYLFNILLFNQALDLGYPVSSSICVETIEGVGARPHISNIDQSVPYDESTCRGHEVIIMGRRLSPQSGSLQYLVKNSWGKNCKYAPEIAAGCDIQTGNFWIDAEWLAAITFDLQALIAYPAGEDGVAYKGPSRPNDDAYSAQGVLLLPSNARLLAEIQRTGQSAVYSGGVKGFSPAGSGDLTIHGNVIRAIFPGSFSAVTYAAIVNRDDSVTYEGNVQNLRPEGHGRLTLKASAPQGSEDDGNSPTFDVEGTFHLGLPAQDLVLIDSEGKKSPLTFSEGHVANPERFPSSYVTALNRMMARNVLY
jgi:uncharacterized protein